MAPFFFRSLLLGLLPLALTACAGSNPAEAYPSPAMSSVGVDLGSSTSHMADRPASDMHPMAKAAGHEMHMQSSGVQMAHAGHSGAHASGKVNSVDPAAHKINVSHGPITDLGWPPMTMDFPVAASVNLKAIKPGSQIDFILGRGEDGMPVVQSIEPVGQGK